MWSNRDARSSVDDGDVVRVRRGQHPHVRLLADERERSEPTKHEPFAMQLDDRRTQARRQGGRLASSSFGTYVSTRKVAGFRAAPRP